MTIKITHVKWGVADKMENETIIENAPRGRGQKLTGNPVIP